MLHALTEIAVVHKDKNTLVLLVSHNCPGYIALAPLEFVLEERWPGSIALLLECYAKADSVVTKKGILVCLLNLGRSFCKASRPQR